jgi:putative tryptophan/tyrosine transport system substrate-binding protein
MIRRRDFITLLGGAAAWPFGIGAHAQQAMMPVIGHLSSRSPEDTQHLLAAFRNGLAQSGYVEGQNVGIEYRWALGQYDRLPALATELVHRPVSVLATTGGEPSALAAVAATKTIPIVYLIGGDPMRQGLAASFNRPGGNATGITLLSNLLEPKRFGLLRELAPNASTIGVLLNPKYPLKEFALREVEAAASGVSVQIQVFQASTDDEIDVAFADISRQHIPALAIMADAFFDTRREKLVALAARAAVPAMYHYREYVLAGGLISYGIDFPDSYRQAGVYTGQVLKGAKPAELPVMQATKFQLVINVRTAKALGIKVSDNVLSLADEVVE